MVTDELDKPNGICFSPDYKKVYICDTGSTDDIQVFDVDENKLPQQEAVQHMVVRGKGRPRRRHSRRCGRQHLGRRDGGRRLRWCPRDFAGGQRIGMIVLPEICANLCFGGAKRNRLFMAASQSLYAVYVGTQGAHVA